MRRGCLLINYRQALRGQYNPFFFGIDERVSMKGSKKVKLREPKIQAQVNGVIVPPKVAKALESQKAMETSDYTQEEKDKFEELTRAINSFNLKFIKGKLKLSSPLKKK